MRFSLAIHIRVCISRYAFQRSTLVLCMVNEVYVSLSPNLSPNLTQKTWCGRDRRAGSTAVPAGTPQEGQTARPDLPPASMAQANPGGGNKGLGRHL